MIWAFSFTHKRFVRKLKCWERRHYKVYMLVLIIPLYINNWKTEYINANGKPIEEQ